MKEKEKHGFLLITIDVEDWFQVENFKPWIPFSTWSDRESRVEKNTHKILDLFDSFGTQRRFNGGMQPQPKATFFILGWIAERIPNLVKEIYNRGHEVASHGYNHNLCHEDQGVKLNNDLLNSKKLLEDIVGCSVAGYRAPSFSVNSNVLKAIERCGYRYDSSYNSFGMNPRYGQLDVSRYKKKGIAFQISNDFFEIPISNITLKKKILPFGGGGYFRLLPFFLLSLGIQLILRDDQAYLFYMHPWEVDPEQPRVEQATPLNKFRHYVNLSTAEKKLNKIINRFQKYNFVTCREYLNLQMK